jgi:hypothetical protein
VSPISPSKHQIHQSVGSVPSLEQPPTKMLELFVYIEDHTMIPYMLNTKVSGYDSLHQVLLESFPQYKQQQFGIKSIFFISVFILTIFDFNYILVFGLITGVSLLNPLLTGINFHVNPKSS